MSRLGRSSGNSWEAGRWCGESQAGGAQSCPAKSKYRFWSWAARVQTWGLMSLIFFWDPENELNSVSHHFLINVVGKMIIPTWFITVQLITYRLSEIFKMDNQQGPTVQHTELCSVLCSSLDGRGVWGRMDTCMCMAESLCCPPDTITTLLTALKKKVL